MTAAIQASHALIRLRLSASNIPRTPPASPKQRMYRSNKLIPPVERSDSTPVSTAIPQLTSPNVASCSEQAPPEETTGESHQRRRAFAAAGRPRGLGLEGCRRGVGIVRRHRSIARAQFCLPSPAGGLATIRRSGLPLPNSAINVQQEARLVDVVRIDLVAGVEGCTDRLDPLQVIQTRV